MKYINKTLIFSAVMAASISAAISEETLSGKFTAEIANFTQDGTTTGADSVHEKDSMKQEISARFYLDGDVNDNTTYHVEFQGYSNNKAVEGNDTNDSYTQRDALREAYIDTTVGDWLVRTGKQQVVWGTADGAKLLDMINPTDYTEMAQNQMEDSRIPVFMINAEKDLESGANIQVIVSEPRENIFAGLNRGINTSVRKNNDLAHYFANANIGGDMDIAGVGTDSGHPFMLMGPDSITGAKNGFLNIVPDLGSVSTLFANNFEAANGQTTTGLAPKNGNGAFVNGVNFFTVGAFTNGGSLFAYGCGFANGAYGVGADGVPNTADDTCNGNAGVSSVAGDAFSGLNFATSIANMASAKANANLTYDDVSKTMTGAEALAGFGGMFGTNLYDGELFGVNNTVLNSAFEYMDKATFGTFNAFIGAESKYVYNMPSAEDSDISFRTKDTTRSGLNYSLNYSYSYDKNPVINMYWEDVNGNKITTKYNKLLDQNGQFAGYTLTLAGAGGAEASKPTLVFEQETKRVHNIGGSFDMALDSGSLGPVVIRGEALYMKDTYSPVMDRGALSYGDLTGGLTMRKGDRFKYVLGADFTALTNMMISVQFIRDTNLDHIDNDVDVDGNACTNNDVNCGVYTVDYSTMHLSNGFNKAEEHKDFYSLFLSKPFGESGQHRWNNILMIEETGGRWNRLDAEYAVNDNTVATIEWNKYWGENNTQFGQLKNSSNIQLGLKYSF